MLDRVLRRSDAVDKESLCILAGQRVTVIPHAQCTRTDRGFLSLLKVWALRLTIHCLADAGNLLDCACLAGIVTLKHLEDLMSRSSVMRLLSYVYFLHLDLFLHCKRTHAGDHF